jgi:hypothetical protein
MSLFERLRTMFGLGRPRATTIQREATTIQREATVRTATCQSCRQEVGTWRTFGDGTVLCVPCSSRAN